MTGHGGDALGPQTGDLGSEGQPPPEVRKRPIYAELVTLEGPVIGRGGVQSRVTGRGGQSPVTSGGGGQSPVTSRGGGQSP